jgi:hypothetical protein
VDAFKGIEGGDCKKMSTAISSVLKCSGKFEPLLKVISYDGINWEHIYVITKLGDKWYTLDPVNDCKFNQEIPHAKAIVYNLKGDMNKLSLLGNNKTTETTNGITWNIISGIENVNANIDNVSSTLLGCNSIGCPGNDYKKDASLGLKNEYFSYTASELAGHIAKIGVLAIPRNAFLGLLYLGKLLANTPLKLNITSRLAIAWNKNKATVQKGWWKLGGTADASALKAAIIKGSGLQLSGMALGKGYDYPIDLVTPWKKEHGISGLGQVTAAAAIVAAAPVVAAMLGMLKSIGVIKTGETDPPVPTDTKPPADAPPGGTPPKDDNGNVTGIALAMILQQAPLYISIPVIAYTLYHYRSIWIKYIPFIK